MPPFADKVPASFGFVLVIVLRQRAGIGANDADDGARQRPRGVGDRRRERDRGVSHQRFDAGGAGFGGWLESERDFHHH